MNRTLVKKTLEKEQNSHNSVTDSTSFIIKKNCVNFIYFRKNRRKRICFNFNVHSKNPIKSQTFLNVYVFFLFFILHILFDIVSRLLKKIPSTHRKARNKNFFFLTFRRFCVYLNSVKSENLKKLIGRDKMKIQNNLNVYVLRPMLIK
jgi:hypothetical protein